MVLTGRLIQTCGLAAAETLYVIYVTKHIPDEDQKTYLGFSTAAFQAGLLVGALDIATANNTVAIVMANPIAKDMSEEYGITPQNTASILDTFSCIFQGVIPYGAQMLIALSASAELGCELSAFDVMPNLIYPYMLLISSLIFMFFVPDKKAQR